MFRKQRVFAGIVIAVLAIMTFVVPLASNAESAAAVGGNGYWETVSMPTVFVTSLVEIVAVGEGYSLFAIKCNGETDVRHSQLFPARGEICDLMIADRLGLPNPSLDP